MSDETDWHYTKHSKDRSKERGICKDYIIKVLEEGDVIGVRPVTLKNGNTQYRYKVSYRNSVGETIIITVVPKKHQLVVLTEW